MSVGLRRNCISPNYPYSCDKSIKMPLQKSTSTVQQMKQQKQFQKQQQQLKGIHQLQIQQQIKQQLQQKRRPNKLAMASFPKVGATQDMQSDINQFIPSFFTRPGILYKDMYTFYFTNNN